MIVHWHIQTNISLAKWCLLPDILIVFKFIISTFILVSHWFCVFWLRNIFCSIELSYLFHIWSKTATRWFLEALFLGKLEIPLPRTNKLSFLTANQENLLSNLRELSCKWKLGSIHIIQDESVWLLEDWVVDEILHRRLVIRMERAIWWYISHLFSGLLLIAVDKIGFLEIVYDALLNIRCILHLFLINWW